MKEGPININLLFMPDNQAAEIAKSSKGAFNFPPPAIPAQLATVLGPGLFTITTVGYDKIDFKRLEPLSQRVIVVSLVGDPAR